MGKPLSIILWRSIYNGCEYLLHQLQSPDFHIRYNDVARNPVSNKEIQNYLEILQKFLPHREPSDKQQKFLYLRSFINLLVHEWDDADINKKNITQRIKVRNADIRFKDIFEQVKDMRMQIDKWDDSQSKDNLSKKLKEIEKLIGKWDSDASQQVRGIELISFIKTVRNLSAHENVFDNSDEQLTAFLFLINMRAMFALPENIQNYEKKLLQLFKNPMSPDEFKNKFANQEIPLRETYSKVRECVIQNPFGDRIFFEEILRQLSERNELDNLMQNKLPDIKHLLFQMFWHCFFKPRASSNIYLPDNPSFINISYSFNKHNYCFENENSFLFQVARHIYNESFKPTT